MSRDKTGTLTQNVKNELRSTVRSVVLQRHCVTVGLTVIIATCVD